MDSPYNDDCKIEHVPGIAQVCVSVESEASGCYSYYHLDRVEGLEHILGDLHLVTEPKEDAVDEDAEDDDGVEPLVGGHEQSPLPHHIQGSQEKKGPGSAESVDRVLAHAFADDDECLKQETFRKYRRLREALFVT